MIVRFATVPLILLVSATMTACPRDRGGCVGDHLVFVPGQPLAAALASSCASYGPSFDGTRYIERNSPQGEIGGGCAVVKEELLEPIVAHAPEGAGMPPRPGKRTYLMREIVGEPREMAVAIRTVPHSSLAPSTCDGKWLLHIGDDVTELEVRRLLSEVVMPPRFTPSDEGPLGSRQERKLSALDGSVYSVFDLTAQRGDVIVFSVQAETHSFAIEGTSINSGPIREGRTKRIRVNLPQGTYSFRCTVVPYMVGGKLVVG